MPITKSAEETMELGEHLSKSITSPVCVALIGELGAGKTVFVKGLAKGLGIKNVLRVSGRKELEEKTASLGTGPTFLHIIAQAGNAKVSPISLTPVEIKQTFMQELQIKN